MQDQKCSLNTPEWWQNAYLLFRLKGKVYSLKSQAGERFATWADGYQHISGFLTLLRDALCCHQMVIHSGLWK